MVELMVSLGQFILSRCYLCGLKTQRQIAAAAGISTQTLNFIVKADELADLEGVQFGTLQALSMAARFDVWSDFLGAWEANDVRRGLEQWERREKERLKNAPKTVRERAFEDASAPAVPPDQNAFRHWLETQDAKAIQVYLSIAQAALATKQGRDGHK